MKRKFKFKMRSMVYLLALLLVMTMTVCGGGGGGGTVGGGGSVVDPDQQAVEADLADLTDVSLLGSNPDLFNVTSDLTLDTTGDDGSTITWSSDNTTYVANDGTVAQPANFNAVVILTATAVKGSATASKIFTIKVPGTVAGTDYYVSTTGDDANTGLTAGAPLLTIAEAIDKCGGAAVQNIFVAAGTYSQGGDFLYIDNSHVKLYGGYNSDFSARNINDRTDILYKTEITGANPNGVVYSDTVTDITIDGFVIAGTGAVTGIVHLFDVNGVTITNNTILFSSALTSAIKYGIWFNSNVFNYTINNNIIDLSTNGVHNTGMYGIRNLYNNATASNDKIENNIITLAEFTTAVSRYGVWLGGNNNIDKIMLIRGNTINIGAANCAGSAQHYRAINIETFGLTNTNIKILNNSISGSLNNSGAFTLVRLINVQDILGGYIFNNVIHLSRGSGVSLTGTVYGIYNSSGTTGIVTANNTLYLDASGTTLYGIRVQNSAGTASTAKNNIVHLINSGTSYCVSLQSTQVESNNCCYVSGGGTDGTVYDASTVQVDPVLNTTDDFQLSSTSPASVTGGGINLYGTLDNYLNTDYLGVARPAAGDWAIGAYVAP